MRERCTSHNGIPFRCEWLLCKRHMSEFGNVYDWMRGFEITLESDVFDVSKWTIIAWLRFARECCESGEVYSVSDDVIAYFALSVYCSLRLHPNWTRMHTNPFEWKSIQASLFNHSHHNQSLSNTTREQSQNAPLPKKSDLREGMSSHHSLWMRILFNSNVEP